MGSLDLYVEKNRRDLDYKERSGLERQRDRDREKMKCDQQEKVEKNPREGLHTSKTLRNGSLALSWAGNYKPGTEGRGRRAEMRVCRRMNCNRRKLNKRADQKAFLEAEKYYISSEMSPFQMSSEKVKAHLSISL